MKTLILHSVAQVCILTESLSDSMFKLGWRVALSDYTITQEQVRGYTKLGFEEVTFDTCPEYLLPEKGVPTTSRSSYTPTQTVFDQSVDYKFIIY